MADAESECIDIRAAVLQKLSTVIDPETGADVVRMRLIEDLSVDEQGHVSYTFRPSSPLCPIAVILAATIKAAVAQVPGVTIHMSVPLRDHPVRGSDWWSLLGGIFQSFWGVFFGGAAHIRLPTSLYLVCGVWTGLAGIGLGLGLIRAWRCCRVLATWPVLAILAIAWMLILGTWVQYSRVAAGTDQARLWYRP